MLWYARAYQYSITISLSSNIFPLLIDLLVWIAIAFLDATIYMDWSKEGKLREYVNFSWPRSLLQWYWMSKIYLAHQEYYMSPWQVKKTLHSSDSSEVACSFPVSSTQRLIWLMAKMLSYFNSSLMLCSRGIVRCAGKRPFGPIIMKVMNKFLRLFTTTWQLTIMHPRQGHDPFKA